MRAKDLETDHESFGTVTVSRISSNVPVVLFESQTRHGHFMELKIHEVIEMVQENLAEGA